MNQPTHHDPLTEAQLNERLKALNFAPTPNLNRGRARVLAELERRRSPIANMPRRFSFALALGISVAIILAMFVMSSAFGAPNMTAVAMTSTESAQTLAPVAVPGNVLTPAMSEPVTSGPPSTPFPGLVPEPPRSPAFTLTRPVGSGNSFLQQSSN